MSEFRGFMLGLVIILLSLTVIIGMVGGPRDMLAQGGIAAWCVLGVYLVVEFAAAFYRMGVKDGREK